MGVNDSDGQDEIPSVVTDWEAELQNITSRIEELCTCLRNEENGSRWIGRICGLRQLYKSAEGYLELALRQLSEFMSKMQEIGDLQSSSQR